jgi:hypothetical protein
LRYLVSCVSVSELRCVCEGTEICADVREWDSPTSSFASSSSSSPFTSYNLNIRVHVEEKLSKPQSTPAISARSSSSLVLLFLLPRLPLLFLFLPSLLPLLILSLGSGDLTRGTGPPTSSGSDDAGELGSLDDRPFIASQSRSQSIFSHLPPAVPGSSTDTSHTAAAHAVQSVAGDAGQLARGAVERMLSPYAVSVNEWMSVI